MSEHQVHEAGCRLFRALAAVLALAAIIWWGLSLLEYAATHQVPMGIGAVAAGLSGGSIGALTVPWFVRPIQEGDPST